MVSRQIHLACKRLMVVIAISVIFTAFVELTRVQRQRLQAAQSLGNMTADQVIARSIPLGNAITGDRETVRYTAEPSRGVAHNWWSVHCTDVSGAPLAEFTWDADHNRLERVSAPTLPEDEDFRPISLPEARRSAISWLRALGFVAPADHWKIARGPFCLKTRHWDVVFQNGQERVRLECDKRSGALIEAAVHCYVNVH